MQYAAWLTTENARPIQCGWQKVSEKDANIETLSIKKHSGQLMLSQFEYKLGVAKHHKPGIEEMVHQFQEGDDRNNRRECRGSLISASEGRTGSAEKSSATFSLLLRKFNPFIELVSDTTGRESKPASTIVTVSQPETAVSFKSPRSHRRCNAVQAGCRSMGWGNAKLFIALLHQLARDDLENLLDALAVLGADFMTAVPSDILAPKPATALAVETLERGARRMADASRGWGSGCLRRIQLLGDVGDGSLKRDGATQWIQRYDVWFRSNDMDYNRILIAQVFLQFQ